MPPRKESPEVEDTEFAALRAHVFAYLADRPDGIREVEIERKLGLSRTQARRVVERLIEEGKARKQGHLYFAT
jgi:DNA-binding IclR family transcriptional regulator